MKMTLLVSAIFSIASWAVGLSPGHTTQRPGCGLQVLPCPPKLSRVSCMELKTGGQSVGTARRIKEMAKILITERLLGSIVGAPYIFRPSVKYYKTPLSSASSFTSVICPFSSMLIGASLRKSVCEGERI